MEITKAVAEYVADASLEAFPPEAVYVAKAGITDALGCMLAGSREPLADIVSRFIVASGGEPRATVVGRGFKTSASEAALVNGSTAHALDYDDITWPMKGHPSAVLLPAVLALGEEEEATGRDVLLAHMVGFEVACNIGAAMSADYYDDLGWHPTGPLGALGAAAAAASLLKLDSEQTAMALSLAASLAGGLRQNFGTMTKPFHAGLASRNGVSAARLVQAGLTASAEGIEGRFGSLRAFSGGGGYDDAKALEKLGNNSYLVDDGLDVKKYPCCGSTHPALDALFMLLHMQNVDPAQVERVEVRVDFGPPRSLIHHRPKTTLEGKFSMEYCIAAALLDGKVGLGSFSGRAGDAATSAGANTKSPYGPQSGVRGQAQLDRGVYRSPDMPEGGPLSRPGCPPRDAGFSSGSDDGRVEGQVQGLCRGSPGRQRGGARAHHAGEHRYAGRTGPTYGDGASLIRRRGTGFAGPHSGSGFRPAQVYHEYPVLMRQVLLD